MPKETVIRDRVRTRLGSIIDDGREMVARNRVGTRLCHYDRGTNSTRDKWGKKIAEGNVVAGLIMDHQKRG